MSNIDPGKTVPQNETCAEPTFKKNLPQLVGPDRNTVSHTTNTFLSFDGSEIPRPDYL